MKAKSKRRESSAFGPQHVTVLDKKKKTFNFDRVIQPDSTQEEVFKCTGAPLVDQVLMGYHSTCFAYGQTGSGKTWTMQGNEKHPGIIPRMVDSLFDRFLYDTAFENTQFTVQIQYIEIYKEKIRDLLDVNNVDLKVRQHKNKGVFIQNCSSVYAASPEEVQMFFEQGHANRAVGCTNMNAHSSRSHSVFMLLVEQKNMETQSTKKSKLMLVDLAGSEKVRKTQATGNLLAEAQSINLSLSELGNVINALTEGRGHVPYRNSKLTWLLSDSIGGNSKTCIIVTASVAKYNLEETISTMQFGVRCKKVKNKPKVNQELSVAEYKKRLAELERRITTQNAQIVALEQALRTGSTSLRKKNRTQTLSFIPNPNDGINSSDISEMTEGAEKVDAQAALKEAEAFVVREEELENKVQALQDERDDLRDRLRDLENQVKADVQANAKVKEMEEKLQEALDQVKLMHLYKHRLDNIEEVHRAETEELKQRAHDAEKLILEGGEVGFPNDVLSARPDEFAPSQDDIMPFPRFESLARNCVQLFLRYDLNRNRVLEKNEIEEMLRKLGIRPREVIIDKVCLAFGMDSWQITYEAFVKTLPKKANEKVLYDFLAALVPKQEEKPKKLMSGKLIDRYDMPEELSKEDLIEGVKLLTNHHKTMMSKLMKAYEHNHLFINQLRQFGKQEETHEEWRAKLRQDNKELTDMIADLNETLTSERKEWAAKMTEAQNEIQEARKKASHVLARPTSMTNRIIKPFQRPVSRVKPVNIPYKVERPHNAQEALSQFRQKFRRKKRRRYPETRIPFAKFSIDETSSPPSSPNTNDGKITSVPPAQFPTPPSPKETSESISVGKDTSMDSREMTKTESNPSTFSNDTDEKEEEIEAADPVKKFQLQVEILSDDDISIDDGSSAYE